MRDRVDSVIECGSLIYPTHPTYRVVSAGEATTIRSRIAATLSAGKG